jgi:hypothetical protein
MFKRIEYHYGTESASAYAENDKVLEFFPYLFSSFQNIGDDCVLVVRKLCPAHEQIVSAAVQTDVFESPFRAFLYGAQLGIFNSLVSERFGHHIIIIDRDAHFVAPLLCFVSHRTLLNV